MIMMIIIIIIKLVSNFPRAVQLFRLRWKLLAYIIDVVKEAEKYCLFSGATKALDWAALCTRQNNRSINNSELFAMDIFK